MKKIPSLVKYGQAACHEQTLDPEHLCICDRPKGHRGNHMCLALRSWPRRARRNRK